MATGNAINANSAGLVRYDGAGTFTGVTTTQFNTLVGAASNGITNVALTNGQVLIGSTGAAPLAGTLTPGTGVSIVNAANSITINAVGGGLTWSNIAASQTMVINHGYQCTGGGTLALLLPAASSVGDIIEVTLDGSTGFTITQAAGQAIRFANAVTTGGAGGSLASTAQGDTIRIVCSVANLRWNVLSAIGNITIV
jgi:hypothetical protein